MPSSQSAEVEESSAIAVINRKRSRFPKKEAVETPLHCPSLMPLSRTRAGETKEQACLPADSQVSESVFRFCEVCSDSQARFWRRSTLRAIPHPARKFSEPPAWSDRPHERRQSHEYRHHLELAKSTACYLYSSQTTTFHRIKGEGDRPSTAEPKRGAVWVRSSYFRKYACGQR